MPFRPSSVARAQKSSSTAWLARQSRDHYVKLRTAPRDSASVLAASSYRSRSAFKLLEMDEKYDFLNRPDVHVVLDLGAAPGGWSQVAAQKLGWGRPPPFLPKVKRKVEPRAVYPPPPGTWSGELPAADEPFNPLDISDAEARGVGRGTIIAVDLLRMVPLAGVQAIQADFLAPETEDLIRSLVARFKGPHANGNGKADVILCDMAANSTGNTSADIASSLGICTSVFDFSRRHLVTAEETGRALSGVLVIKHFVHPLTHMFRMEHLVRNFADVRYYKPDASRAESKEAYFLARGFKG